MDFFNFVAFIVLIAACVFILMAGHRCVTKRSHKRINDEYEKAKQALKNQTLTHWLFKTESEAREHELKWLNHSQRLFNASRSGCEKCH